jgi:hypothetical protein
MIHQLASFACPRRCLRSTPAPRKRFRTWCPCVARAMPRRIPTPGARSLAIAVSLTSSLKGLPAVRKVQPTPRAPIALRHAAMGFTEETAGAFFSSRQTQRWDLVAPRLEPDLSRKWRKSL